MAIKLNAKYLEPFVQPHELEGIAPLVLSNVRASCGCTRPEYPEKPIKPGEKGKIKITYNPAGRPGEFDRKIKIQTNDKNRRPVLKITGVVIPQNNGEE